MKLSETYQFVIFIVLLLTISCKNQEADTLKKHIKKIDDIPISQSLYIIEIDSSKNILDTIALRKLKYDVDENLIFENNFQLKLNVETINYYDPKNGMIYSEVRKNNEKISDFQVNLENGLIISANYNVYENGNKDNVFMKYHYTFDNKKKTKLVIDSGDDFTTTELYNEFGKPILNFSMDKKDTIEKTIFVYDKNNIVKVKKVQNFSRNQKIIYEYNNGFITKESFIINGIKDFHIEYYKDEQGNYLSYTKNR